MKILPCLNNVWIKNKAHFDCNSISKQNVAQRLPVVLRIAMYICWNSVSGLMSVILILICIEVWHCQLDYICRKDPTIWQQILLLVPTGHWLYLVCSYCLADCNSFVEIIRLTAG